MRFSINRQQMSMLRIGSFFIYFFLLDRILKRIAIKGIIAVSLNENIAFGIPCPEFILYPLLIVIFYFVVSNLILNYQKGNLLGFSGFILIFIGALSNVLDRIIYSFVIDYLSLFLLTTINLADLMILIGVAILFYKKFRT